ncbi:MAG TPA: four helix bundle protein [Bacteroidales bacterium]|nr:four helix bundle protein [Bacteroidales bacterium]
MQRENPVLELSFQFALDIIDFAEKLEEKRNFVLSNQVLRSGTSIGANVREAQSSESKQDFIHKMKIASKEAEETEYWLLLCKFSKNYPRDERLLDKVLELKKLLGKIISSAKTN